MRNFKLNNKATKQDYIYPAFRVRVDSPTAVEFGPALPVKAKTRSS